MKTRCQLEDKAMKIKGQKRNKRKRQQKEGRGMMRNKGYGCEAEKKPGHTMKQ